MFLPQKFKILTKIQLVSFLYVYFPQATDGGGMSGSTILDVRVDRGPNTGGPYFPRRQFSTVVHENTLPGTSVIRLKVGGGKLCDICHV